MFSPRWKLLKALIEGCSFITPDRQISHCEFLRLSEAFLLQVKESEGMIYIIPSEETTTLATYFADALTNTLKISACAFVPVHKDIALHLALLLKKTDLVIILETFKQSANTLAATAMTKTNDIPLIIFSGDWKNNSSRKKGDLEVRFDTIDKHLIQTGQFSLFSRILHNWPYNFHLPPRQQKLFPKYTKSQPFLAELRI